MTKEAIETIRPYLDAANVDLKFFKESSYKNICKAALGPVLDSIRLMHESDIWVELTTLVIPGLNDSDEEFTDIAKFIVLLDEGIPWHVSAFHPDYTFTDYMPTPVKTLQRAQKIGLDAGLKFVHLGNVIGF
jgi:pyruvate formate lyase activating enzyme